MLDIYHVSEHLDAAAKALYGDGAAKRPALADLRDYLAPHEPHTGYAERLRQGPSIGSGRVEGACTTVVGRGRKPTGARGRVRHAERILALNGVLYSDLWDWFWAERHN